MKESNNILQSTLISIKLRILFKYADEYHKKQSDYETIIVSKMKNFINFVFNDGFW